jgi:hypothetical protein
MSRKTVDRLASEFDGFCRNRPRANPGAPEEPIEEMDLVLEFYRDLERRKVDLGSPTDEDMVAFLKGIGITDRDQQMRAIEASVDWQLADRAGRPVIGAQPR